MLIRLDPSITLSIYYYFQSHSQPTSAKYNNIYNIVLPQFCLAHEQELKVKFGLPKSSPNGDEKTRDHFFSKWGHHDVWNNRWRFDYGDRQTFELVKDQYKDTLLWDFYNHDPVNGPLKSFNI